MKKIKLRIGLQLYIAVTISFFEAVVMFILVATLTSSVYWRYINDRVIQYAFISIYFLLAAVAFFITFHFFVKKRIRYLNALSKELEKTPVQMPVQGSDEITYLAMKINDMYDRIQKERTEKEELITHLSHDLRTPLTSIIGYLDILQTKTTNAESLRYLQISYDKAIHLSNLQTALFDYIKISDKDFAINLQTIDISIFLEQLLTDYILSLNNAGIEVELVLPENHQFVVVDLMLLHRVADNIFSNIQKYAKSKLRITTQASDTQVFVCFENDHSLENIDTSKIFDRFYTGETSRTKAATGLGLAIAKIAIEKMGGTITATVSDDKFRITLGLLH